MRPRLAVVITGAVLALAACRGGVAEGLTEAQAAEVRRELEAALREAYDLSKPDVTKRMLALYPKGGRVVSTTAGRVGTSRDTLEAGIRYFWESVGVNMRGPRWIWDSMYVDVLSPTSAVVTASYHIPHKTPANVDHVIAGAMTAVFAKRDARWVIVQEHLSDLPAAPPLP